MIELKWWKSLTKQEKAKHGKVTFDIICKLFKNKTIK